MHEYSAAGRDGWSAKLLKECKASLDIPIYLLWRKSLDTGVIHATLKHANITPQFKGSDKTLPKNYRPGAPTSNLTKIFERILRKKHNKLPGVVKRVQ